jgi:hypothetical protein
MADNVLYSRDLLYMTEKLNEPGSVHIDVLQPTTEGKMPVIIEGKTANSPLKYIDTILRLMQTDIFDRIRIDVKTNLDIYIKIDSQVELKKQYDNQQYLKIIFNDNKLEFKGCNGL